MSLNPLSKSLSLAFAAAFALILLVPAAKSDASLVTWSAPTPADHSNFSVKPGGKVSFALSAVTTVPGGIVHISPVHALPVGSVFSAVDGTTAGGTFSWHPERAGDYTIQFVATTGTDGVAPTLTYSIHVAGKVGSTNYPRRYSLADDKV